MSRSMHDGIGHRQPSREYISVLQRATACSSVVAPTFFVGVCELNAIETIPLSIECMGVRSNVYGRNRDIGAEQSETKAAR